MIHGTETICCSLGDVRGVQDALRLEHLQWCLRINNENSNPQLAHSDTSLSGTHAGPFELIFFCAGCVSDQVRKRSTVRKLKLFFHAEFTCGLSLSVTRRHIILPRFLGLQTNHQLVNKHNQIIPTPRVLSAVAP